MLKTKSWGSFVQAQGIMWRWASSRVVLNGFFCFVEKARPKALYFWKYGPVLIYSILYAVWKLNVCEYVLNLIIFNQMISINQSSREFPISIKLNSSHIYVKIFLHLSGEEKRKSHFIIYMKRTSLHQINTHISLYNILS